MGHGAEDAEARGDPHRLADDRINDDIGGLVRGKHRNLSYILVGETIRVRTSGMLTVVKWTPRSRNSEAAQRAQASSAALDAT